VRNILVDTGPIVALLHKDDKHHKRVTSFIKQCGCGLLTTWPVMTEAWHLLPVHGRIALTGWALNGGVAVLDLGENVLTELDRLLRQYRDRPMDLADASLVLLAERTGLTEILTIDRADFDVYRLADGRSFQQVMPAK